MDNDFLLEMAAEVQGIATQDQPLFYVEVVAEYEVEAWCFWNEITILFLPIIVEKYCLYRKLHSF